MVKNIYLPLAERLIEKYINENKVEAEAGEGKKPISLSSFFLFSSSLSFSFISFPSHSFFLFFLYFFFLHVSLSLPIPSSAFSLSFLLSHLLPFSLLLYPSSSLCSLPPPFHALHSSSLYSEVKLYLMVLDKLGKTERKLEVIRGELGKSVHPPSNQLGVPWRARHCKGSCLIPNLTACMRMSLH